MSTDVRVPTTGNAGEDAVIVDWNVEVGSQVSAGDILVVLETAKATIDVEAPVSGEVLKIMFGAGDEAPEHDVLAILGAPGETVAASAPASDPADPGATSPASPTPAITLTTADSSSPAPTHSSSTRVAASPRARILAERNGIDLSTITGTGPGNRIIIIDVMAAKRDAPSDAPSATPAAPAAQPPASEFTVVPVRGARKVTAQRMHESLQSTAQVTLTRYAKADAMLAWVARIRSVSEKRGLPKIGVNDVLLFATARAVAKHPEANSWFDWDGIKQFRDVNLGFAVDTGQALLVPVIARADTLSLTELASAAKAAIQKSRDGKLTTDEMQGGTFTVSNLGSLGVHWFTPVLNPPQSCILGVGATHQLFDEGPRLLPLSLTFDHRAIDGATAAAVLADIAGAIETVDLLGAL
ncbi:MAG: dihydrolipoamide acetyltransferase family protein [Microbacteriaceae bacterium]